MKHEIYAVTEAEIVGPYTLKLTFDDVTTKTIDFRPVLKGELFGPLQDVSLFNKVVVDPEAHTIVWPNGADFDPATLHDWNVYAVEIAAKLNGLAKVAEERASYGKSDTKE